MVWSLWGAAAGLVQRLPSPLQRRLMGTAQLAATDLRQRPPSPLGSRRGPRVQLAAAGLRLRLQNFPASKPRDPAQWTVPPCPMRKQPAWLLMTRQHRAAGRRLAPRLPLRRQLPLLQGLSLRLQSRQGALLRRRRWLPCPLLLTEFPAGPRRSRAKQCPLGSARPRSLLLCQQMGRLC